MTQTFDTVVIGAGALGAATAYHLMREGQSVALLERGRAASETSPRAAGMGMQLQADDVISPIARLGIDKLVGFEQETGQPLTVHQPGSVKVARTEADAAQLEDEVRRAHATGIELDHISAEEARRLAPWFAPDGALAMWYAPGDTYLEPGDLPRAYVAALRAGGGTLLEHTPVTAIGTTGGRVTHVQAGKDRERFDCGDVVIAAGAWSPVVAALAGAELALWPVRHELIITEPIGGVSNEQPAVRVMDAKVYVRPCRGGLMFGGYEPDPLAMDLRGEPASFAIADMPLDDAPMRALMAQVRDVYPSLSGAPWAELRGGLTTLVPDGHFLVGALDPLDGLWLASGCNVGGLSTSPALGAHLAHWIASGERHADLAPFDPNRFGDRYADPQTLRRACLSTYVDKYSDDEVAVR
jgi:glycine/D-amino acid oxidase-like deaminating enzyme